MRWWADRSSPVRALALAFACTVGLAGAAEPATEGDAPGRVPRLDEAVALRTAQAAIGRTVSDYTLLDRQGRPVSLARYRGKPLLVSFVYTGCFQVCPASTRNLKQALEGLDRVVGPDRYQVVSIGFNQPFDSPTAMRVFAAQQRIDRANWEFLSPPAPIVEALTRDFGFSYVATPAGFDHVVGVTVVDAGGRIVAQVLGDRIGAEQIGEPLRALLGRALLPPRPALADVIERVRILCTVYDPETGEYRTNYALLGEVVGGLGFFVTVAAYLIGDWRQRRRAAPRAVALRARRART